MRRLIGTLLATTIAVLVIAKILSTQVSLAEDGSVQEDVFGGDAERATLADVMRPGARFVPLQAAPPGTTRWVRLTLSVFDREDRYVVERGDFISEARLSALVDGRAADFPTGSAIPLKLRPLPSLKPSFEAPPAAVRGAPMYIRESGGPPAAYRVLTAADYYVQATRERLFFGLYFGVLIAVGVYHLLMFAVLGGLDFLSYGLYLGALVLQQLARTHYYETLVPDVALDYNLVFSLSYALLILAAYWLFRSFLLLGELQPRIDLALRTITIVAALSTLAIPLAGGSGLVMGIRILSLSALALVLYAAWKALRAGLRSARWFIVALAGLFLGSVATSMWSVYGRQLPPSFAPLQFGFETGAVFQALILALGLADRIAAANEERDRTQRRAIEEMRSLNVAFARFVPQAFLELLGKRDVREVALGDQVQREMTILFSDIRSFTTLSEGMSPSETFGFLNGYLSRTGPIVREHGGLIDKYVGDAIMALFPRGPDDAVRAAIALQATVTEHNRKRQTQGRAPIAVGVGLHTGTLMLGTIGETERMDGTVIADAVNLASRVESLTKLYGAAILLTDATRDLLVVESAQTMRYLGRVAVKGKHNGVGLFEVIASDPAELRDLKIATSARFAGGVTAFVAGNFAEAVSAFDEVLGSNPQDRAAAYLRLRSIELREHPAGWDGVDQMTVK